MKKLVGFIILLLVLSLIYGSVALSIQTNTSYELNELLIVISLIFNVVIMVGAAILFIWLYYGTNIFERLYFTMANTKFSVLIGAVISIVFLFIIGGLLAAIGYTENNQLAEQIGENLSIFSLILIPSLSAISEEVFFRGLIHMQLEQRIGFLPSVVISSSMFSLAHLEYETLLQIIIPFAFGFILGYLIHKYKNIWAPISAHFTYNFIALLAVYVSG